MSLNETNTFVYNLDETLEWQGHTLLHQPKGCADTYKEFMCPCCPWADYSDGVETLRYRNGCVCCDYPWFIATAPVGQEPKDIGALARAGACENGCLWCLCPMFVCSFPNLLVARFHSNQGHGDFDVNSSNLDFTIRRDVACCDGCMFCIGATCYTCVGPCSWCCKYCDDKTGTIDTLPFWDANGTLNPDGSSNAHNRYGEFQFASRLMPIGCCCIKVPVRYIVKSNKALDSNKNYDGILGAAAVLARGLPGAGCGACFPCAAGPVPRPTGISCMDRGLHSTTDWMTFQELCQRTHPDDGAAKPTHQAKHQVPQQMAPGQA